jgi:hypothetical protein
MTKEKIPVAVRNGVWHKYIGGLYYSECFCCNFEPITKANYECGHVVSEKNGGKVHLDNLRPICSACNKSIGIRNMEHFMEQYGFEKNENWYGIDKKKISNNHISTDSQQNPEGIKPESIKKKNSNLSIENIYTNKINICKHKYVNGSKKGTSCKKPCRGNRCYLHKKTNKERKKEYYREKKKEIISILNKNVCKHQFIQGSKKGTCCNKSCRGDRCKDHKKKRIERKKEYYKEKNI